jgi:4,5:9,10-diseco-3-hydroxy-5,9,17-trioxoandrosta-1(10),2-diene-4-oate hydrolase
METGMTVATQVQESFFISAAGTRIHGTRSGTGEPVVCLHATGHSARDFLKLSARLGGRYQFIALDWPGQGESPRDTHPASAARYAEILADAVGPLGLERFTILGNSIGGAVAIIHAARNPGQVNALVLCNPGGLQRVGLLARLLCGHMAKFLGGGARGDKDFARKFRRYYEKTVLPEKAAAWRREEIIASANAVSPVLAEAWRSFGQKSAGIRHLTPKLHCPVLYAWAKRDAYVAWSRSKRAALRAPNSKVVLFDAGHCAFLEQPERFDEAFTAFMDANVVR